MEDLLMSDDYGNALAQIPPDILPSSFTFDDLRYDSGVYDLEHGEDTRTDTTNVALWQKTILQVWYQQHLRILNHVELQCLTIFFNTTNEEIEAYVLQLHEANGYHSDKHVPNHSSNQCRNKEKQKESYLLDPVGRTQDLMKRVLPTNRNPKLGEPGNLHADDDAVDRFISDPFTTLNNDIPGAHLFSSLLQTGFESFPVHNYPAQNFIEDEMNCNTAFHVPSINSINGEDIHSDTPSRIASSNRNSVKLTQALNLLVMKVIRKRKARGCKSTAHYRSMSGPYICTLGCGYKTKRPADLVRHEETVYPQHFYFCFDCCDSEIPSERHLFTRKDKFIKHVRSNHTVTGTTAEVCKVPGVPTAFPKRCTVCLHHSHKSWLQRCNHNKGHHSKGDFLRQFRSQTGFRQGTQTADDEDDDSDEDDDDDDDDDENAASKDGDAGNNNDQDTPDKDERDGHGSSSDDSDPGNEEREGGRNTDHSHPETTHEDFDFSQWISQNFSAFPTSIRLRSSSGQVKDGDETSYTTPLSIRWLSGISREDGPASVFKAAFSKDLDNDHHTQGKVYVVKQCTVKRYSEYLREISTYALLQEQDFDVSSSMIRWYGSFRYRDHSGAMRYNVVLESGECDLLDYLIHTRSLISTQAILEFWEAILHISTALKHIHEFRIGDRRYLGYHGDIKPENIIFVQGKFKLADFGFAQIVSADSEVDCDQVRLLGGTRAYCAPELAKLQCLEQLSVAAAQACDIWAFGCSLLVASDRIKIATDELRRFRLRHRVNAHTRRKSRASDVVTDMILHLVRSNLLVADPTLRHTAGQLSEVSEDLIRCLRGLRYRINALSGAQRSNDNKMSPRQRKIARSRRAMRDPERYFIRPQEHLCTTSERLHNAIATNEPLETLKWIGESRLSPDLRSAIARMDIELGQIQQLSLKLWNQIRQSCNIQSCMILGKIVFKVEGRTLRSPYLVLNSSNFPSLLANQDLGGATLDLAANRHRNASVGPMCIESSEEVYIVVTSLTTMHIGLMLVRSKDVNSWQVQ